MPVTSAEVRESLDMLDTLQDLDYVLIEERVYGLACSLVCP